MIEERGFDAAGAVYAERGRESKRQWNEITGRTYGVKVASDWRPDGWLADMDSMTTQQAEESVTAAREALAALHQVQAVSEAEAQSAGEAKVALPDLQAALKTAADKAQAIRADLDGLPIKEAAREVKEAEQELVKQRELSKDRPHLSCPHCKGAVIWLVEREGQSGGRGTRKMRH